jgi:hypothetical protein
VQQRFSGVVAADVIAQDRFIEAAYADRVPCEAPSPCKLMTSHTEHCEARPWLLTAN